MRDLTPLREKLEATIVRLRERVGATTAELRAEPDRDSGEQALELEDDEVLERLDEQDRNELAAAREALGRMEAGSYGICEGCGRDIPVGRLEALPYARTCVRCASS